MTAGKIFFTIKLFAKLIFFGLGVLMSLSAALAVIVAIIVLPVLWLLDKEKQR